MRGMPPSPTDLSWVARYKEIIVALIAVFGVVVPYLIQRNKELNLKIAEQKRRAYARFLKEFHRNGHSCHA